jgi:hypothetical protein
LGGNKCPLPEEIDFIGVEKKTVSRSKYKNI